MDQGSTAARASSRAEDAIAQRWWSDLEERFLRRLKEDPPSLEFDREDRLILDTGLYRNPEEGAAARLRGALLKEIYAAGPANVLYLTEYITERLREAGLLDPLPAARVEEVKVDRARSEAEANQQKVLALRRRTWKALTPLIKRIPGINKAGASSIHEGQLEDRIDNLLWRSLRDPDHRIKESLDRAEGLRERLFQRLRAVARTERESMLVTAAVRLATRGRTAVLEHHLHAKRSHALQRASNRSATVRRRRYDEQSQMLKDEVAAISALLELGRSGEHSGPVTLRDGSRTSRERVGQILELAEDADRGLPPVPRALVAPYGGEGFFDWERDTLFLPLRPTGDPDRTIAEALGRFRLLWDYLHGGNSLKDALAGHLGARDFASRFVPVYGAWIVGCGGGDRSALTAPIYGALKRIFAPGPDEIPAPAPLLRLSPAERAAKREAAQVLTAGGRGGARDHLLLGWLTWLDGKPRDAMPHLSRAADIDPLDGRVLYSLAVARRLSGDAHGARTTFAECAAIAHPSLWRLLAEDALARDPRA